MLVMCIHKNIKIRSQFISNIMVKWNVIKIEEQGLNLKKYPNVHNGYLDNLYKDRAVIEFANAGRTESH